MGMRKDIDRATHATASNRRPRTVSGCNQRGTRAHCKHIASAQSGQSGAANAVGNGPGAVNRTQIQIMAMQINRRRARVARLRTAHPILRQGRRQRAAVGNMQTIRPKPEVGHNRRGAILHHKTVCARQANHCRQPTGGDQHVTVHRARQGSSAAGFNQCPTANTGRLMHIQIVSGRRNGEGAVIA